MALNYRDINDALPSLLHRLLESGTAIVGSRNGTTRELMMQQITLRNPDVKECTVPGRKVSLPAQIAETMWILAGRNDIEWLSYYLPRAKDFSDDGKTWRGGYGPRLRGSLDPFGVDQLAHIVSLLKEDPETRRAVFNIYDPAKDTEPGKDIPCNNWVHFLPRGGTLHAHVAIRSNDLFWGWSGINAFEWTSLLQVVAGLTGMERGSITFSISSLHLYEHHWKRAESVLNQWTTKYENEAARYQPSPAFTFVGNGIEDFDALVEKWFKVEGQIRKGGLSSTLLHQVATFPEPMLRSWLFVLLSWVHDDIQFLKDYRGTALYAAAEASPKRKDPSKTVGIDKADPVQEKIGRDHTKFIEFCHNLHVEKNAAYGNSWMKRGEMLGIMANCARKVDRLGVGGAGDTAADTAIDLLMYFIKYDIWLDAQKRTDWADLTEGDPHVNAVHDYLQTLAGEKHMSAATDWLIDGIKEEFNKLEQLVMDKAYDRDKWVKSLICRTYPLAIRLWAKEQRDTEKAEAPKQTFAERNATRSWNPEPEETDETPDFGIIVVQLPFDLGGLN